MYVILVYDVEQERVNKVCKFLRQHLHWVQNSAFEGHITEARLRKIERELEELIDPDRDSIYVYCLPDDRLLKKRVLGVQKGDPGVIV